MKAKMNVKLKDGSAIEYQVTLEQFDYGFDVETRDLFLIGRFENVKEIYIKLDDEDTH